MEAWRLKIHIIVGSWIPSESALKSELETLEAPNTAVEGRGRSHNGGLEDQNGAPEVYIRISGRRFTSL
jgi:hypothetical protein